jgi:pimeloyl-ACP methyl ester carboxylesterase
MSVVILWDDICHYEVLGRGRPLIFLHGWVGSWRYWVPAMQAASISFRTYAIDLWGFGDSAKDASRYSLDQQIELLDRFMQELGIGKIALAGHGLGAVLALLYASRFRRFVDRLIAIGLPNAQHPLSPRLSSASPPELAEWLVDRTPAGDAVRQEIHKTDPRAIQASLADLQNLDLPGLARDLATPCLLVYGQNDPLIEGSAVQDLPTDQPELTHQIVFENSGHFPMLDEGLKFNRLVADFLALSSGVSPRQLQLKEEWKRRVR